MKVLPSKLPSTGTSIFTEMSQLATQCQAINLSQGFPDFNCSPRLVSLVAHYLQNGYNQYAPMAGVMKLRERISAKVEDMVGAIYHPDTEVTVTAGATQAIFTTIASVVRPGDEVIIFEPAYDSYAPSVSVFGGIPKPVPLRAPDFIIDWVAVKQLITPQTRLIIINSPNNPTGRVFLEADYRQLIDVVSETGCYVLSDEVYEHIVYDGRQHRSAVHYSQLRQRTFVVASFGKLYHTTGWKIGYCLAPEGLMAEFRKVHQFNVFSVNTPMQYAIADFMADSDEYLGLPMFFERKRDFLLQGLETTLLRPLPCQGTYFVLADYSAISELPELEFCRRLTKQGGVATIPVAAFYSDNTNQRLVRICFAKQDQTLASAIARLANVNEV